MGDISARLRRLVVDRARNRCEYCGLSQVGQEATFHVDHVIPVSDGGPTAEDNLALACVSCSLREGAQRSAVDPDSGLLVPLFSPRRDSWAEHFQWDGVAIGALTPTGRASIELLKLNRPLILAIREEESERGRHPPD
ncbi:MAG: HNH endonuclease [Planctomycetaceae bacterium]|nr:HNH endonuclease [Planctomycetaceae bacterium]